MVLEVEAPAMVLEVEAPTMVLDVLTMGLLEVRQRH